MEISTNLDASAVYLENRRLDEMFAEATVVAFGTVSSCTREGLARLDRFICQLEVEEAFKGAPTGRAIAVASYSGVRSEGGFKIRDDHGYLFERAQVLVFLQPSPIPAQGSTSLGLYVPVQPSRSYVYRGEDAIAGYAIVGLGHPAHAVDAGVGRIAHWDEVMGAVRGLVQGAP